ncbi:MAG: adenylate/guanylate cyclase domain-containing protein, partial [Candidatus Cloacimonadaceae bacterium]|nr:adenylate/guanylate cyclase domain-containing protein [Candidatus Cloacimonadaceae bacterium]
MDNDELLFGTDFFELERDNLAAREKLHLREGELREVTMLFADIKGFTDLSTHFEPEIIPQK